MQLKELIKLAHFFLFSLMVVAISPGEINVECGTLKGATPKHICTSVDNAHDQ
jgi:hypothetical protein